MGRFIVLFLVVGAVVMFLLVLNTPPQMVRDSYLYQRYVAVAQEPLEALEPEPTAAVRTPSRRRIAQTTRSVAISSEAPDNTAAAEPLTAPRIEYTGMVKSRTTTAAVSFGNDALVYSSNSTNAPILKVLNKGQIVEVDMEFITPGGRWALVRIPGDEISGFVRTDGLVLMPAATTVPAGAQ